MITKYEYLTLKERHKKGYRWIARDKDGCLYIYHREPKRLVFSWKDAELSSFEWSVGDDSFPCVKWEDEKPTKILDLIQDYEKQEELKKKVTIPQFVADWIEECKPIYNLRRLFSTTHMPDSVQNWTSGDDDNCNLMALAWIYGYEVEKEKLYVVELINNNLMCCLAYDLVDKVFFISQTQEERLNKFKKRFTEQEIKDYDERYWPFAEEVTE